MECIADVGIPAAGAGAGAGAGGVDVGSVGCGLARRLAVPLMSLHTLASLLVRPAPAAAAEEE
jgi:hypothetical protein